jgi:ankyrin repeat protein
MSQVQQGRLFCEYNNDGLKFRPSDWMERLALLIATFDNSKIQYSELLNIKYINCNKFLFVSTKLRTDNEPVYNFVMHFLTDNNIKEYFQE